MALRGRLGLRHVGFGTWWIGLGMPKPEKPGMYYDGWLVALGVTNVNMEQGELRKVAPLVYRFKGWVWGYYWDSFVAKGPIKLVMKSNIPFDIEINGKVIRWGQKIFVFIFPPF